VQRKINIKQWKEQKHDGGCEQDATGEIDSKVFQIKVFAEQQIRLS